MTRRRSRVLLPLLNPALAPSLLDLGGVLAGGQGEVLLLSIAEVADRASVTRGLPLARAYRLMMSAFEQARPGVTVRSLVRVSDDIAAGIAEVARETECDLLLLPWKGFARHPSRVFGQVVDRLLAEPPCDVALIRTPVPSSPWRVLVAARGGSYAALAVELGTALASGGGRLTVLHAAPAPGVVGDRPFEDVRAHLLDAHRSARLIEVRGEPQAAILAEAERHDLVVLGATGQAAAVSPLGPIGERLAHDLDRGLLVVKTRAPLQLPVESDPDLALSARVDRWFAENTYQYREFSDLGRLVDLKRKQGLSISLGLPSRDHEATIMGVLKATRGLLQQEYPLLDEIVVLDRGSTDATCKIAEELGVTVCRLRRVLPRQGGEGGLGEALWKSLHVLQGDLIAWLDPDVRQLHPRLVYGVLGPLLTNPELTYVTGFSPPPNDDGAASRPMVGCSLTELVVRPLLNLLAPELSGLVEPLAIGRAGRRTRLERVPFFTGEGVGIGLLLDLYADVGLRAIGQVDVGESVQAERSADELARAANAVVQVLVRRLGDRHQVALLPPNPGLKQIRLEHGEYVLGLEELTEEERPPINSLPAYRRRVDGRR